ncbi:hypothetical protein [Flavobacterium sp. 316]|uniref:hypothetical protein n=1 Tax=Flavobacterium sp. 316 TaxID=1603293 RepID=UPI000AA62CB2|nr:hypothetical protein [Flavobacterium sp. 316]
MGLSYKFDLELLLYLTKKAHSSFYYYQKQNKLPDIYKEIKELIKTIYKRHKEGYGYRK